MSLQPLFIDSDNLIRWDQMQNAATGAYVNDAVVTFTLRDVNAVAVSAATNVSMPYVAGSDGRYQGTLESTVDLGDPGTQYDLEITATSGALVGFRRVRCIAQYQD